MKQHRFEPFYSTKSNGTGLGLAVSHEIVTQHGGRLEAISNQDQGATFTLKLPVAEKEVEIQPYIKSSP